MRGTENGRKTIVRIHMAQHTNADDHYKYAHMSECIDGDNNINDLNSNNNESGRIIAEQYGFKRDITEGEAVAVAFFWWLNYSHYISIVGPNHFSNSTFHFMLSPIRLQHFRI